MDTVIFDLDGTLLYTLEDLHQSANFVLAKYGFDERSLEEIRSFVGFGVQRLMERCVPQGAANPDFYACLSDFKAHYSAAMHEKTRPYDGVMALLDALKAKNIKCAVVSNKFDTAAKELCAKYFEGRIDIAVGEKEGVRKKPAPDSVLNVIKELGAKNCVYIGDSEVDIKTAQNAQIPCISVSWGYKDKDFLISNGANVIADTPKELLDLLLKRLYRN